MMWLRTLLLCFAKLSVDLFEQLEQLGLFEQSAFITGKEALDVILAQLLNDDFG